jgi:hypothetical protein
VRCGTTAIVKATKCSVNAAASARAITMLLKYLMRRSRAGASSCVQQLDKMHDDTERRVPVRLRWRARTVASISATASIRIAISRAPTLPVTTGLYTRGGCLRIVVVVALLMAPAMDRGPVGDDELLLPPTCELQKHARTRAWVADAAAASCTSASFAFVLTHGHNA